MIIYKWILALLVTASSVFGQSEPANLSISGNLKVWFGRELLTPDEATIELVPAGKITTTDSVGNYTFDKLASGTYYLQVLDYNFKPQQLEVELTATPVKDLNIIVNAHCEVNTEVAQLDLEKNEPRLLLIGGIAPIVYLSQTKAERQYGFQYYDFGCTPPESCVIQYNKVIFDYLDKTFGTAWRKEVRHDVIGL